MGGGGGELIREGELELDRVFTALLINDLIALLCPWSSVRKVVSQTAPSHTLRSKTKVNGDLLMYVFSESHLTPFTCMY